MFFYYTCIEVLSTASSNVKTHERPVPDCAERGTPLTEGKDNGGGVDWNRFFVSQLHKFYFISLRY